jgi:hypothetical protein
MLESLIILIIFFGVFEFATLTTYGELLKDDAVFDYLYEFEPFEKNPFDNGILGPALDRENAFSESNLKRLKSHKFISHTKFSLLSKYYISGLGTVPRWSEAHKTISKLYKNAKPTSI